MLCDRRPCFENHAVVRGIGKAGGVVITMLYAYATVIFGDCLLAAVL